CRALLGLLTLTCAWGPSPASAQADPPAAGPPPAPAVKEFHLYATDGEHRTAEGNSIYIWGYTLSPVQGTATLPGPPIEVNEGDRVRSTLTNLGPSREAVQEFPHTVHLHGLDVSQANDGVPETSGSVRVGESLAYEFVATDAGTYWYHCHVDTVEHL